MAKSGSNIYKRKDGRYEGRILLGKDGQNKTRYLSVYAKTLREVRKKMEEARGRTKETEFSPPFEISVEKWIQSRKRNWKPTTYDVYRRIANRYIIPGLGTFRAEEITPDRLIRFSDGLLEGRTGKPLSEQYRKYICSLVRRILLSEGINVCPQLPEYHISHREMLLPEADVLKKLENYLLEHLEESTCLGILLVRYTGIRIGELCALQWKDIDLEKGVLTVRRNLQRVRNYENGGSYETENTGKTRLSFQLPKTSNSVRKIPLADGLLKIVRMYARSPEEYVVAGKRAKWAEVRTVQYRFASILKKCGLQPFHFHLLRHSFASECIYKGCDLKSLSEILGHSSVQITMNIYVHSNMGAKKEMMNLVCGITQ